MEKVKLGEIAKVITKGTTPTSIGYNFEKKGINFVKIESISETGEFLRGKFSYISEECNEKLSRSKLIENDILFSIAGAIGRVAIVNKAIIPANTNQALAIIRTDDRYDKEFLKYVLTSNFIKKQYNKKKQGVAQINLSLKDISELEIPVLDIKEQTKISNRLSKLQEIIDIRKKQIEQLDKLIKSQFVEMFGDIKSNNKNWKTKKGSELFIFSSGKGNIASKLSNDFEYKCYGGNGITGLSRDYLINYDTIVIGRVGAYCGSVNKTQGKVWITDNAIYIKEFKENNNIEFLEEMFKNIDFHRFANFSGQPKITQQPLQNYNYIVPPLSLQNQFAEIVKKTNNQKSELQKSLEEMEKLQESLMNKYFG